MTTPPTPDAGVLTCWLCTQPIGDDVKSATTADAQPMHRYMNDCINAQRDHIATLTAQLAAAKADGERLDWMMSDHDGIHVEVHHYGESYGGALSSTVFTFDGEYSAKTVREALDAARTGAR